MAQPAISLPAPRAQTISVDRSALLMTLLLGVVAFLVLAPLTLMLLSSFQLARPGQPAVYGLAGWQTAFTDRSIVSAFGNTLSLSIVREGIALVVGVILAWLIARTDLFGKNVLEFVFWVAFFLPPLPIAMGWILLLDERFGLINQWLLGFFGASPFSIYSFWGIVWVHLTTTIGVKVLLLAPAFRNLDAAMEESSRSCGVTALGTLRRIVVPLMAPAILVSAVLGLIRSLDAFEIELLLGTPIRLFVYSTQIRDLVSFAPPQYAPASALGSVLLVVLLVLVAVQRLYLRKRIYRTISGRGFSTRVTPLGRWRWPTFAIVAAIAATISVVPVAVLVMGTFMRAFGYFNIPNPWTTEHWQRVLSDPLLVRSLQNTLVVGLGSAII